MECYIDHVGLSVDDLAEMREWFSTAYGCSLVWHEDPVDVPPTGVALDDEPHVRLTGNMMRFPHRGKIEAHQYFVPVPRTINRRSCDLGLTEYAIGTSDIHIMYETLAERGVRWFGKPHIVTTAGEDHWSAYGIDPLGAPFSLVEPRGERGETGAWMSHFAISVRSLDQAQEWYMDALGCQEAWRQTEADLSPARMALDDELEVRVSSVGLVFGDESMMVLHEFHTPEPRQIERITSDVGVNHYCIGTTDEFAMYRQLQNKGVKWSSAPYRVTTAGPDHYSVYGKDPYGVTMQLCAPAA